VTWAALILIGTTTTAGGTGVLFGQEPPASAGEKPSGELTNSDKPTSEVSRASAKELEELSGWVRWVCLMNMPEDIEDTRRWGQQRQVIDGLDVKLDGLRVDTKRRWKMVNDGTWSRYKIEFVEPQKRLGVEIHRFDVEPGGKRFVTSATVVAPLKLSGRVNQFARDVQLFSVSAKADALVAMRVDCEVDVRLIPVAFPPDVEFRPKIKDASIELREFRVHEISQIHGEPAEWMGDRIREVLETKLEEYREKLVEKMNRSIEKQQHRDPPLLPILLRFSPHLRIPFLINLHMDRISSAADGTIFHVRLTCTFRKIQRDDDFFAASVADIASFFLR